MNYDERNLLWARAWREITLSCPRLLKEAGQRRHDIRSVKKCKNFCSSVVSVSMCGESLRRLATIPEDSFDRRRYSPSVCLRVVSNGGPQLSQVRVFRVQNLRLLSSELSIGVLSPFLFGSYSDAF